MTKIYDDNWINKLNTRIRQQRRTKEKKALENMYKQIYEEQRKILYDNGIQTYKITTS